jgi:hypothetical protein
VFKTVPLAPAAPPTATVQPTLIPVNRSPAKPLVGTIGPVPAMEGYSSPQHQPAYQAYPGVYQAPQGGYIQAVPYQQHAYGQSHQAYQAFPPGLQPYPAHSYSYQSACFPPQQQKPPVAHSNQQVTGAAHSCSNHIFPTQAMFSAAASSFPQGGYYIAAPYPGPTASSTNNNPPGYIAPRTTSASTPSTQTQGFIYGPYSYPYSGQQGGRVVGPVIALGLLLSSLLPTLLLYGLINMSFMSRGLVRKCRIIQLQNSRRKPWLTQKYAAPTSCTNQGLPGCTQNRE